MDFRCGLDFLELRNGAQAGWFGFTGAAAARNGKKNEGGSDDCGKNSDHGNKAEGFMTK